MTPLNLVAQYKRSLRNASLGFPAPSVEDYNDNSDKSAASVSQTEYNAIVDMYHLA